MGEKIARLVHETFQKLPKKGKPNPDSEWTVLAGIVRELGGNFEVVSLGTGTSCLGANETSPDGYLVHDSHAEVVCKRAFVLYLMNFLMEQDRDGLGKFHFYSSHPPCGDATIAPKEDKSEGPDPKKPRMEDIHRTGAKCLADSDLEERTGTSYHVLGEVRTKPGRGDPTLSLSCSDKMLKWNLIGLQGSFVAPLLTTPLKWSSITIGSDQFSHDALKRALFDRIDCSTPVPIHSSKSVPFVFAKMDAKRPSPCSIAFNVTGLHEVVVDGRKQGIIKKHSNTIKAAAQISRLKTAKTCVKLLTKLEQQHNKLPPGLKSFKEAKNYQDLKELCSAACEWQFNAKLSSFKALSSHIKQPERQLNHFIIDQT